MKETITETILIDGYFTTKKLEFKRVCSGKFEIFAEHPTRLLFSLEKLESKSITIGEYISDLGVGEIVLKYESDFLRDVGTGHEL